MAALLAVHVDPSSKLSSLELVCLTTGPEKKLNGEPGLLEPASCTFDCPGMLSGRFDPNFGLQKETQLLSMTIQCYPVCST